MHKSMEQVQRDILVRKARRLAIRLRYLNPKAPQGWIDDQVDEFLRVKSQKVQSK